MNSDVICLPTRSVLHRRGPLVSWASHFSLAVYADEHHHAHLIRSIGWTTRTSSAEADKRRLGFAWARGRVPTPSGYITMILFLMQWCLGVNLLPFEHRATGHVLVLFRCCMVLLLPQSSTFPPLELSVSRNSISASCKPFMIYCYMRSSLQ